VGAVRVFGSAASYVGLSAFDLLWLSVCVCRIFF